MKSKPSKTGIKKRKADALDSEEEDNGAILRGGERLVPSSPVASTFPSASRSPATIKHEPDHREEDPDEGVEDHDDDDDASIPAEESDDECLDKAAELDALKEKAKKIDGAQVISCRSPGIGFGLTTFVLDASWKPWMIAVLEGNVWVFNDEQQEIMTKWMFDHEPNPRPNKKEWQELAQATGAPIEKVKTWFGHHRPRILPSWQPRATKAASPRKRNPPVVFTTEDKEIMSKWYIDNKDAPYPNPEDLQELARQTNKSPKQVLQWMRRNRSKILPDAHRLGTLSPKVVAVLQAWLDSHRENPKPTPEDLKALSIATDTPEDKVLNWINHNRPKLEGYTPNRENKRLRKESVAILTAWTEENLDNPYPDQDQLKELCRATGFTKVQVHSWLIHNRPKLIPNFQPPDRALPAPSVAVMQKWLDEHKDGSSPEPDGPEMDRLIIATELDRVQIYDWFTRNCPKVIENYVKPLHRKRMRSSDSE
ncbi:hypothetical protein DL93DRAFT_2101832 [Clavulina sp. PMI_390]|nr:hypothetical protein DL93DRAFT_2101832 [Clavulina sp. PMI_390]